MPTALFISPHLDDVAFSCGGLAAVLADRGWRTVLATVFTRSVVPAAGFALACQLDKGLPPEIDYMALRREEDAAAGALLGFSSVRWLDLLEAPHRGYESAPALFGPLLPEDAVAVSVLAALMQLSAELQPDLFLAPQGLGNHVDHQLVAAAVVRGLPPGRTAFYRDAPYALRRPDAEPLPYVPRGEPSTVPVAAGLGRKIAAAQAYGSQVGLQFGGPEALAQALGGFALQEGGGVAAERFVGCPVGAG